METVITKFYHVLEADLIFINGVASLCEYGIGVSTNNEIYGYDLAYAIDDLIPIYNTIFKVTLSSAEQTQVFDNWYKKEEFRFALKGMSFLQHISSHIDNYV